MPTILLVEDNPEILELFQRIVERSGYTTLTATTAEEAFQICNQDSQSIDLLLADVFLGRGDSIRLAQQITKMRPGLHVLLISGYPWEMIAGGLPETVVVKSGRVSFLQKPFSADTLINKVTEVLCSTEKSKATSQA